MTPKGGELKCHYDEAADVLYASFGKFTNVVYDEIDDGIVLRLDPSDGKAVGITITNYRYRVAKGLLNFVPDIEWLKEYKNDLAVCN